MAVYVVVRLWIREGRELEFEAYERKVARIMARHGGGIEQAIRVLTAGLSASEEPFEVQVLKFPSQVSFQAFQEDAERHALASDRADVVTRTEVFVGVQGPVYASTADGLAGDAGPAAHV
jgi:uncharacterized protein (DUF1330 family)